MVTLELFLPSAQVVSFESLWQLGAVFKLGLGVSYCDDMPNKVLNSSNDAADANKCKWQDHNYLTFMYVSLLLVSNIVQHEVSKKL